MFYQPNHCLWTFQPKLKVERQWFGSLFWGYDQINSTFWDYPTFTSNLITLGQNGEYQTEHENNHEHRRIAGVGVFLAQGVSASRATSQDYEPTVSVKGGLISESFSFSHFLKKICQITILNFFTLGWKVEDCILAHV